MLWSWNSEYIFWEPCWQVYSLCCIHNPLLLKGCFTLKCAGLTLFGGLSGLCCTGRQSCVKPYPATL